MGAETGQPVRCERVKGTLSVRHDGHGRRRLPNGILQTLVLTALLTCTPAFMAFADTDAAAGSVPHGYWVDVDESGTSTSDSLGGGGSLSATGTGNVNYGWGEECAPSGDGGPFSSGRYPPATCPEVGRSYGSTGSPESPPGFWFTGNQHCVAAGRSFSGATFTWHVQLPQTGPWHVEAYIPSWTSYGWGNQYVLTAADGRFESTGFIQQAYHGQWVQLFGSHQFDTGQDYTVELTLADTSDSYCHYQMADQMRWVYDGPSLLPPVNTVPPMISGEAEQGQRLTEAHGSWTNNPTSYSYQWEDCDSTGISCSPIPGATLQSYTLTASDVGHAIVVQETAINTAGASQPANSAVTLLVLPPSSLTPTVPPASPSTPTTPVAAPCPSSPTGGLAARAAIGGAATHNEPIARIASLTPAKAVARTVAKRSRHFSISIELSKGLAKLFDPGQQCAQTLSGRGYVNFRRRAARWTVALPEVFHGNLNVIAIGNRTYVSAPWFTSGHGVAHRAIWIELNSIADYKTFDSLPLLRDIVVLTNPLRSLDVLRSTHSVKRARGAVSHDALAADSPSLTASCSKEAKAVANGDSVDAKHLTDEFSINTSVDGSTIKSWAESKISAEADRSGVCEESITMENAKADGFDVVFDFTASSPKDEKVKAPQSTATVEWKVIYHVKQAPCLDGIWETTQTAPLPYLVPGESGSYTVVSKAEISGHALRWSRHYLSVLYSPHPEVSPGPMSEIYYLPDATTTTINFDASGVLEGLESAGAGYFKTGAVGADTVSVIDTLGNYPPNLEQISEIRPMELSLDCRAGTLTVEQNRVNSVGAPLTATLRRVSPTPPPQITVEQDWRSALSAPVQPGSS
jgi:hypothetical protein